MDYAQFRQQHYPIGSGVTEAACKTLIKQRLCCSGMRWKEKGASIILSLRALILTSARWEQFWDKLNQYGFPLLPNNCILLRSHPSQEDKEAYRPAFQD